MKSNQNPTILPPLDEHQMSKVHNQIELEEIFRLEVNSRRPKSRSIPTKYLALPLGKKYNSAAISNETLGKMEKKLSNWKRQ
ncbi:hypothetical protein H5410_035352 [Solanum commersonii]|uniref:Uncharacterized protein n=1 Tax=Solanum commersonii TaxID=4109 RepID=A0A9J5Y3J0_SOLCO|nr:hypothetical protein H5410_035352 [Solanum commersonii]